MCHRDDLLERRLNGSLDKFTPIAEDDLEYEAYQPRRPWVLPPDIVLPAHL